MLIATLKVYQIQKDFCNKEQSDWGLSYKLGKRGDERQYFQANPLSLMAK